tara:strand:+ start:440 stop:634 length:195 start_codon:yes stop_codon:yes gene_type:complete
LVEVVEEDPETLDIHIPVRFHQIKTLVLPETPQKVLLHQIMLVLAVVVDKEMDHHHQEKVSEDH